MMRMPRPRSRWEMIWNIAMKDLEGWWKPVLIAVIVSVIMMILIAATLRPVGPYERSTAVWGWELVSAIYAVAAFMLTLAVGLSFGAHYGGEIKSGTIKALILYPVDLNDLTLAKLLSSSIIGSIEGAIMFFMTLAPFFAYGIFSVGGAVLIFLAALFTVICIIFAGAFLAHLLAYLTNRLIFTPSVMAGWMLLLAVLTTQQGFNAIGLVLLFFRSSFGGAPITFQDTQSLWATAGGISILSPHHATATVLTGLLGPAGHFPDIYFALPLGIIFVFLGFWLGRRVYLDVFIR